MIKYLYLFFIASTLTYATSVNDKDFDGVIDSVDRCPDTPFLNKVDQYGCTTTIMALPEDIELDTIVVTLGLGSTINEDILGRDPQTTKHLDITYYDNDISYSLSTGYYEYGGQSGNLDTTLKVNKRISFIDNLKVSLGLGLKLPTYDFIGNNIDYELYSSMNYYYTTKLSLFTSLNHTFIEDDEQSIKLRDTTNYHLGVGYFMTSKAYMNFAYSYNQMKFTTEHSAKSLSSMIYYKINKTWFSTLKFSQDIDDEDLHRTIRFNLSYKVW